MTFSIGAILSITTGICLAQMSEIHELLDHMTGDTLYTHQLPRAAEECEGWLREQFPQFHDVVVPQMQTPEDYMEWVTDVLAPRFGARHEVQPLPANDHTIIDPLAQMAMNYPHVKVIPVVVDHGDQP